MKRLFSAILAIFLFVGIVYADPDLATVGGINSSGEYDFVVNSSHVLYQSSTSGIRNQVEVATTTDTLAATETGKTILFAGTVNSVFTLPAASTAGLRFTFVNGTTKTLYIDTQSSDTILNNVGQAAGNKVSDNGTTSDSLSLVSDGTSSWYVDKKIGTWTNAGP